MAPRSLQSSSPLLAAALNLSLVSPVTKTPQLGRFFFLKLAYLIGLGCLGLGWLLPMHVQPWVSWHSEAVIFFGVFAAAGLVLVCNAKRSGSVDVPVLSWPVLALAVIALLQGVSGRIPYSGEVLLVWFYSAFCVVCLMLGYAVRSSPEVTADATPHQFLSAPALLARALVLIGIASAGVGMVQAFDVWTQSDWFVRSASLHRHGGQVGQANHFAIGLLLSLVSVIYLFCSKKLGGVATLLVIVFLGMGLAVSESRAGFLSVLGLCAWWTWKQPAIAPQLARWWGIAIAVFLLSLFVAWPPTFDIVYLTGDGASTPSVLGTGSLRFVVWPQLLHAALAHPWLGWGVLQVAPALNSVAHGYPVSDAFTYSHTVVLDLVVWLGIPLALIFLSAVMLWLWRRTRAVNNLLTWYLLGLSVPLGVGSLLEFPYVYAYCLAPVLFALGMLEREVGCKPLARIHTRVVAVSLLLVSLVMIWSVVEYFEVEEDVRVARFEALRVGRTADGYVVPHIVLLTQVSNLALSTRIVPMPGLSASQMELLKNAALRYPWTATGFRYALALALNGNQAEAQRQMQVIRAMQGEKAYLQLMSALLEKLATHQVLWMVTKP